MHWRGWKACCGLMGALLVVGCSDDGGSADGNENHAGANNGTGSSTSSGGASSGSGGASSSSGGASSSSGGASSSSGGSNSDSGGSSSSSGGSAEGGGANNNTGGNGDTPIAPPIILDDDLPPAGAGNNDIPIPIEAHPADTSSPTTVVGDGTPASCTSEAFVSAVLAGGVITFNCGSEPHTIELEATARVHNLNTRDVVIDGGGLITLSGQSARRILYQNSCDSSLGIDNERCDLQDYPRTTVQNLTFVNGFTDEQEGGGAIYASGGHLKIVNCRFFHNRSAFKGPDSGGGAVRVAHIQPEPVYIVQSTFGGPGELGNVAANGAGLSGIFGNFDIYNTVFENNETDACCGNPTTSGTGGGSGGAIYMDGLNLRLNIRASRFEDNVCLAHGSAIFFVSNDRLGILDIEDSVFRDNVEGEGNWYPEPDISMHSDTEREITGTTFE